MRILNVAAIVGAITAGSVAFGQGSNISVNAKFAWQENTGWVNLRDSGATPGQQGVLVGTTFMSGFAWSENAGYINFGDGTPSNGTAYANVNGTDFGVNIDAATGDLFGFAWAENLGWINFDTRATLTASNEQARIEDGRFAGFAWSENAGWLNLSANGGAGVCEVDFTGPPQLGFPDGTIDPSDLTFYLDQYVAQFGTSGGGGPNGFNADLTGPAFDGTPDGTVDASDLTYFLDAYINGCP